jgi:hypothetical protein
VVWRGRQRCQQQEPNALPPSAVRLVQDTSSLPLEVTGQLEHFLTRNFYPPPLLDLSRLTLLPLDPCFPALLLPLLPETRPV